MSAALLLLMAVLPQDSDKDKLKDFEEPFDKKEKKQDDPAKPKPKAKGDPFQDEEEEDDDDWTFFDAFFESFAKLIFDFVALPFKYAFSDRDLRFDDHPYAGGRRYFQTPPHSEKLAAFDASLTVGRVEHDLWSVGVGGTIRWASGSDFHFDITQYMEDVEGGTDRLTLQQYGLSFGAQGGRRSYQASFGFGLAVLNGEETSDAAPMFQATFIHFPKDPLSLRFHVALMAFSGATVTDLRFDLGFHFDRFAVTAGVRSLINSDGPELTGPTLGLAIFF